MARDRISYYSRRYGIPEWLARAQIGAESGGRKDAVSPKGATGLTQVLPSTAAEMMGISVSEAAKRLHDPEFALDVWGRYMKKAYQTFKRWDLALAAYNAGFNAVKTGKWKGYSETTSYVEKIMAARGKAPAEAEGPTGGAETPRVLTADPLAESATSGLDMLRQGSYSPQRALRSLVEAQASVGAPELPMPSRRGQPTPAAAGAPGRTPKNWKRWVNVPTPQGQWPGPGPEVLGFVAGLAKTYGRKLTVFDTSTHSRMTVNNNVSAHTTGDALDIEASGRKLIRLGQLALMRAGMSRKEARKIKGGLFNVGGWQIIFNTQEGGDHTDHVHVGRRR